MYLGRVSSVKFIGGCGGMCRSGPFHNLDLLSLSFSHIGLITRATVPCSDGCLAYLRSDPQV